MRWLVFLSQELRSSTGFPTLQQVAYGGRCMLNVNSQNRPKHPYLYCMTWVLRSSHSSISRSVTEPLHCGGMFMPSSTLLKCDVIGYNDVRKC